MRAMADEMYGGDGDVRRRARRDLVWWPDRGMGWLPVSARDADVYGDAYIARYEGYAQTDLGVRLLLGRRAMLERHAEPCWSVIDVGAGAGTWVRHLAEHGWAVRGYDVAPRAVHALSGWGLWGDPYHDRYEVMTCWDSLEHVRDPAALVAAARRLLLVSMPVYHGYEHVLRSRHLRPREHRWYWTHRGWEAWLRRLGWRVASQEQEPEREEVYRYACVRA